MDKALERLVWRRARGCCEYCLMPREYDDAPFGLDHIIARKHQGATTERNISLSCFYCNSFKGPNIAGRDKRTPLFNPRRHVGARHFRWQGAFLKGRTAIGRVTIAILKINDTLRVELRQHLMDEGIFPP